MCALVCFGWLLLLTIFLLSHPDALGQFSVQSGYRYQLPASFKALPDSVAHDYASQSINEYRNDFWQPVMLNPTSQGTAASASNYFIRLHATKGYSQFTSFHDPKKKVTVIIRLKSNEVICDVHESK